ncbi:hypothetical protein RYX36_025509 [Vicia faba]
MLGGSGMPDPSLLTQLMQNPAISQMMQSMLSNPQTLSQILGAANTEQRGGMPDMNSLRDVMQNPEFLRLFSSPYPPSSLVIPANNPSPTLSTNNSRTNSTSQHTPNRLLTSSPIYLHVHPTFHLASQLPFLFNNKLWPYFKQHPASCDPQHRCSEQLPPHALMTSSRKSPPHNRSNNHDNHRSASKPRPPSVNLRSSQPLNPHRRVAFNATIQCCEAAHHQ